MPYLFSFLTKPVQHIDLGSGRWIYTIILGVIFGLGISIRVYWKDIKKFFTGKEDTKAESDPTETDTIVIDSTDVKNKE